MFLGSEVHGQESDEEGKNTERRMPGPRPNCCLTAALSSQVNELDAIPLILDSCTPDDSNPCILKWGPHCSPPAHPPCAPSRRS